MYFNHPIISTSILSQTAQCDILGTFPSYRNRRHRVKENNEGKQTQSVDDSDTVRQSCGNEYSEIQFSTAKPDILQEVNDNYETIDIFYTTRQSSMVSKPANLTNMVENHHSPGSNADVICMNDNVTLATADQSLEDKLTDTDNDIDDDKYYDDLYIENSCYQRSADVQ